MLKNMFTIAFRNAARHKQFTFLNIVGLSIGLTACLLIGLYVQDEYKFDKHYKDLDRLYRVNMPMIWGDWEEEFSSTGPNVAIAMQEDLPEFEQVTRIHEPDADYLSYDRPDGTRLQFDERDFFVADTNFFEVFSFEFVKGDPKTAFNRPGQLVITEETAERYFGTDEPIGKTIHIERGESAGDLLVSGVIKNIPIHSHIQFDMIATMYTIPYIEGRQWTWIWTTFGTYAKVRPGVDIESLEAKMQKLPAKWGEVTAQRVFQQSWDEYIGEKNWFLTLQPMSEAYIHTPPSGNRFGPAGNIQYIQIFSAVGILVLILSCVNFMNLSTARSANRAKEVGIRKVLGSERSQLIKQFIFESILYVLISTILAIVISEFVMGEFNAISAKELSLYQELQNPINLIGLFVFVLGMGLIAGSYPAFYLSSFMPITILKGKSIQGFKAKKVRNILVFFQFTMSIALILCTVFVQKQLNYTANYDLGFNKSNILQIENLEILEQDANALKNTLAEYNEVSIAARSSLTPPFISDEDKYLADEPEAEMVTLKRNRIDENYLPMLGVEFLWGRNFDKTRPDDQRATVINEAALQELGWTLADFESGDKVRNITLPWNKELKFKVIGIVKDFNYNSLKYDIDPLFMIHEKDNRVWDNGSRVLSLRLEENAIQNRAELLSFIDKVESEFDALSNGGLFEYSFLDRDFESTFRNEQKMGEVLNIFTIMAISIACLGLFGLASFTAEQRKKELGVRKVLGASVGRLIYSFGAEFSMLIILAILVASPLAFLFVNGWLEEFAYKTPISWWVFALSGLSALGIAWLTIGYQSLRSAMLNPAEVLRDE